MILENCQSCPKRRKPLVASRYLQKKYRSQDGETIRYKTRLVTKGYAQKEGIEYNKVFSTVVKYS